MPNHVANEQELSIEKQKWLEARKLAALQIDPETAEVDWSYAYILDPYGLDPNLPDELKCSGRVYFARSPGSDIWVSFYDLPTEVRDKLWEKHKSKLAFPAGLPVEKIKARMAALNAQKNKGAAEGISLRRDHK